MNVNVKLHLPYLIAYIGLLSLLREANLTERLVTFNFTSKVISVYHGG